MQLTKRQQQELARRDKNLIDTLLAGADIQILQIIYNLSHYEVLRVIRWYIRNLRIEKKEEKRKKGEAVKNFRKNMAKKGIVI